MMDFKYHRNGNPFDHHK